MEKDRKIQDIEKVIQQLQTEVNSLKDDETNVESETPIQQSVKQKQVFYKSKKFEPKVKPTVHSTYDNGPKEKILENQANHHKKQQNNEKIEKKEKRDWETTIGQVWLPRIFIFIILIGVIWGFKVVVDAGLLILNETGRVVLGFIAAGVLYWLGMKQVKHDRTALGKVLLVGSIALLLLTTVAMTFIYSMISSGLALCLSVIWVGIGIFLSARLHSQAMGIMFAVVGYLLPFLSIDTTIESNMFITVYELIFYVALLLFASAMNFKKLFYISAVFLHFVYSILLITSLLDASVLLLITIAVLTQHLLLLAVLYLKKIKDVKIFGILVSSFLSVVFWAMMHERYHWNDYSWKQADPPFLEFNLCTLIMLVLTVLYGVIAYRSYQTKQNDFYSLAILLSISAFTFSIFNLIENVYTLHSILLLEGTLLIYIGYRFSLKIQKLLGTVIYAFATLEVLNVTYIGYDYKDNSVHWGENLLILILWVGTLYGLYYIVKKFRPVRLNRMVVFVYIGHMVFLLKLPELHEVFSLQTLFWLLTIGLLGYLYQNSKDHLNGTLKGMYIAVSVILHLSFIAMVMTALTPDWSYSASTVAISFGSILYAAGHIIYGFIYDKKKVRVLGLVLLLLLLLKLVLIDLFFISLALRAILFIGIGVIGMFISRLYYVKK